ncbi:receptor-like protein 35, partial [Raphanus sativus]|uniref:Receptor-like protein 35 n=1 Tax=Raphanus sativus TaxID=3726 RepID=A0A9W3BRD2_RAPSA
DLSGNHFSAAANKKSSVPPSQSLVYMDLSQCGINGFFPELLKTQQRLRTLDISNNKIKGLVPGWLWMLPNLENLELSNNTFTGFERPPSKHGLLLSHVRNFLGSNNNFTGEIPSFICALRSLSILDLSRNNFNGSIPLCFGNLKSSLSVLNLRHNRLHGGLPENILGNLRSLDVGHNHLTGKLPRSLSSPLEILNVESNGINDTFPFWLSCLTNLQVLVLRSNAFHGPIHQASFPKLRIIDISRNHFSGYLPTGYFVKWSAMSSLGTNREDRSKVNYMDVKYMGDEVDYGYYHDSVVLMNRGLEMELVTILKIYTTLDFSGNELEGEIPKSIGLLKEIRVLNLSNNGFTGRIPSSLGNLTALESLDVSRNKLSGEIPQELGSLSYLAYMNFSHNQLVGPVPGGTQFGTQNCTSFEDNKGLFGPSLDEACRDVHAPASHKEDYETTETEGEEEEVVSWIAAAIGSVPGIVLGLTIGYVLTSHRPEWFVNPFGRKSRRSRSTTT